jgi:hypothetical protein
MDLGDYEEGKTSGQREQRGRQRIFMSHLVACAATVTIVSASSIQIHTRFSPGIRPAYAVVLRVHVLLE